MVGDTWLPTASMRALKYYLADAVKHKARVHHLDFIWALLQAKVKNRFFVKLDIRYTDYFPEYAKYFGRALRFLKYMYGMTNSGKLFADELTEWLLEAGFIKSQYQMSIYYKYAPDGSIIFVLSYVDDCVYWYTNEYLWKWFIFASQSKEQSFVKLDMRYTDYFPEYAKYFGRALRLLKSMYGMTNSGKLFSDELT